MNTAATSRNSPTMAVRRFAENEFRVARTNVHRGRRIPEIEVAGPAVKGGGGGVGRSATLALQKKVLEMVGKRQQENRTASRANSSGIDPGPIGKANCVRHQDGSSATHATKKGQTMMLPVVSSRTAFRAGS